MEPEGDQKSKSSQKPLYLGGLKNGTRMSKVPLVLSDVPSPEFKVLWSCRQSSLNLGMVWVGSSL